jgi:hypothetical protein
MSTKSCNQIAHGKIVNVYDFCKWIDTIQDLQPFRFFTLDVISDPDKSYKNLQEIRSYGHNPIPVFMRGENYELMRELLLISDIVEFYFGATKSSISSSIDMPRILTESL